MSCVGKVALVTGASRGIGRGIALALAKEGARVYITGRHKGGPRGDGLVGGLDATAAELTDAAAAAGGACIPLLCDHNDDEAVEATVAKIFDSEGNLDILVNNAFSGGDESDIGAKPFWEKSHTHWDKFHRVGLRCHYIATAICARRWVPQGKKALVVNVSSAAGFGYTFDVAYGVGKAGVDRLTADTHQEFKNHEAPIAVVSLWPGAVATEEVMKTYENGKEGNSLTKGDAFNELESVEFSGRGVAALAADPKVLSWSGRVALTPELAEYYGFTDLNGKVSWGNFLGLIRGGMAHPPRMWSAPKARKLAAKL